MEQNVKICPYCGCVGAPDYVFCARCGRPLPERPEYRPPVAPSVVPPTVPPVSPYTAPPQAPQAAPTVNKDDVYECCHDGGTVMYEKEIDGIPTAEVSDYIGKNRNRILPKFFKQSYGAKGGWNWMVFLFGMLGVPFVWFFYRKMNKHGTVLLIISLVLTLCSALTIGATVYNIDGPVTEYYEEIVELNEKYGYERELGGKNPFANLESDNTEYQSAVSAAEERLYEAIGSNDVYQAMQLLSQAVSLLSLALTFVVAIFADRWYYKKAMADLSALNQFRTPDCETVMATGGTRTSSAVISAVLFAVAGVVITIAVVFPFLMELVQSINNMML